MPSEVVNGSKLAPLRHIRQISEVRSRPWQSCSDLVLGLQGWGDNDRGVSYTFGSDTVTDFLNKHDLDLVCRAHQVGYLTH